MTPSLNLKGHQGRYNMKSTKILTVLGITALALGSASAYSPVQIDDAKFDYYTADVGYTSLDFDNGKLMVVVTETPTTNSLEVIIDDALPLDADIRDNYNSEQLQSFIAVNNKGSGIEVSHENTNIKTAINSYTAMFLSEGFSSSIEKDSANQEIITFEQDGQSTRVIFTQKGNDVTVFFSNLTS